MSERRSWVLDVCRYCGAKAIWPGCEHWQIHERWTMPVIVRGTVTLASFSPPSTNEERCGAVSLDGVTCQLVEGHQGVHKNDARHWRNAAHPATNGEEGS